MTVLRSLLFYAVFYTGSVYYVLGSVLAVAYLVVFGSLIAYTAYEWLLRNAPARTAGTYAFVNPVVAVLLGWWLLDEPLGARTVLAGVVIAAAVALIVLGRRDGPDAPAARELSARSGRMRPLEEGVADERRNHGAGERRRSVRGDVRRAG